ncbi:MAG: hypothetical protein LBU61_06415 [Coriobacteriales bacterium]|nr:hypothetical protein [Coriobacteriales bacterium]
MVKEYRLVAYVNRSRGLKGEVEVQSTDGLPLHLRPGAGLWVVPPTIRGVRQTKIISQRGNEIVPWLFLEGIVDRQTATQLVGRYLLAAKDDVLIDDAMTTSIDIEAEAVGMLVYDEVYGFVGTIVEESRATPQTLWTVDGPAGQVLIPAVDDFIKSRDTSSIYVKLPAGLLELNK